MWPAVACRPTQARSREDGGSTSSRMARAFTGRSPSRAGEHCGARCGPPWLADRRRRDLAKTEGRRAREWRGHSPGGRRHEQVSIAALDVARRGLQTDAGAISRTRRVDELENGADTHRAVAVTSR